MHTSTTGSQMQLDNTDRDCPQLLPDERQVIVGDREVNQKKHLNIHCAVVHRSFDVANAQNLQNVCAMCIL